MAGQDNGGESSSPAVKILEETQDYEYKGHYKIVRARLQYRKSDGQMSEPVTRLKFERGSAAAVLLYDRDRNTVIFVKQFRYPVYASLQAEAQKGGSPGWLLEIIAGVQDEGQSMAEVARREAEEEAGYRLQGDLEPVCEVYSSPGASSERIAVFLAEVSGGERPGKGGGLAGEGEDTQMVELPYERAMEMLARGEIRDAKTMIALQYLALKKQRQAHA